MLAALRVFVCVGMHVCVFRKYLRECTGIYIRRKSQFPYISTVCAPVCLCPSYCLLLLDRDPAAAPYELCFAGLVAPLGFNSFVVTRAASSASFFTPAVPGAALAGPDGFVVFTNEYMMVQFDGATGAIAQIQRFSYPPISLTVNQSFAVYEDLGNACECNTCARTPVMSPFVHALGGDCGRVYGVID